MLYQSDIAQLEREFLLHEGVAVSVAIKRASTSVTPIYAVTK
jgi:hypothetical protein